MSAMEPTPSGQSSETLAMSISQAQEQPILHYLREGHEAHTALGSDQ